MSTKFSEAYQKGILSKKLFLESEITKDFIEWLIPFINGGGKNLKEIKLDYDGKFNNFNDAINTYEWQKDKSFNATLTRFKEWRTQMEKSTESECKNICIEILKWGGVSSKNKERIENITSIKAFLKSINVIIKKSEIKISELNPNEINSGYTKIYTALNSNFIMYDGRVGSALCYLVYSSLIGTELEKLPLELDFGYGLGRGKNSQKRNPNSIQTRFHFKEITQSRKTHFISNIKANWLLESISKKVNISNIKDENDKVFALQTALFVLGYEIPNQK